MTIPHRIAVIPGDGIGKEVMPEGLRVLDAAARRFGIPLQLDHFDFASCDYYARHGKMMPDDWKDRIGGHDAIFYGAVGWPDTVPDHISLWGSLLLFRREFDQYVNLRPVRLMPGIPCPLANRKPGDIDFYVVRENTEGEYSSLGGRAFPGTDREVVIQESIFTRHGTDRIIKYAFELARKRKKQLTSATKSLMADLIELQPREAGGGGGISRDDYISSIASDVESKLPSLFDLNKLRKDLEADGFSPVFVVLVQELERWDKLNIKMSKSLKNFIKIGDAVERYGARALRFLCLLSRYNAPMHYSDRAMEGVAGVERVYVDFFASAKAALRSERCTLSCERNRAVDAGAAAAKWLLEEGRP